MTEPTPPKPSTTDWKAIEAEYRAGVKSLRQIASEHGCSHVAIAKRAKKEQWVKDLGPKIRQEADLVVTKALVNSGVNSASALTKLDERTIIAARGNQVAQVTLRHQSQIARQTALMNGLLLELEIHSSTTGHDLIAELIEALRPPEEDETAGDTRRRRENNRKVLEQIRALPGRIHSAKLLTEILEKLHRMEREAYGMASDPADDPANAPGGSLATLLKRVSGTALPVVFEVED